MRTAKWIMLIIGGGAVLLVVLLAGCVHEPGCRADYSTLTTDGVARDGHYHSQPIDQSRLSALREKQESISAFHVLEDGINQMPPPDKLQTVVLSWDASPSPNLKCYRIHFGTNAANYSFVTNVGLVLSQTVVLPHQDRWLFAITAVDVNGVESPLSEQAQSGVSPLMRSQAEAINQIKP